MPPPAACHSANPDARDFKERKSRKENPEEFDLSTTVVALCLCEAPITFFI
jgi:hypothetical protein